MKINWGTGIIIAFIAFIGFILFMIVSMMTKDNYNYDLVTEEYYKKELAFQDEIDAENNSNLLSENISIQRIENGLLINFPKNIEFSKIEGTVFVYRPSNKGLDFEIPINLSNHELLVSDDRLLEGRWNISVVWQHKGVNYLYRYKTRY